MEKEGWRGWKENVGVGGEGRIRLEGMEGEGIEGVGLQGRVYRGEGGQCPLHL